MNIRNPRQQLQAVSIRMTDMLTEGRVERSFASLARRHIEEDALLVEAGHLAPAAAMASAIAMEALVSGIPPRSGRPA